MRLQLFISDWQQEVNNSDNISSETFNTEAVILSSKQFESSYGVMWTFSVNLLIKIFFGT